MRSRRPPASPQAVGLVLMTAPVLFFLMVPSLIIVPMALSRSQMIQFPPDWISVHAFTDYLYDRQWIDSTLLSFRIALAAALIGAVAGSSAAIALHGRRFVGREVLAGLIMAPIVLPAIVLALGDYLLFARLQLVGSGIAITAAHSVLATPYVFISVGTSLTAELSPALVRSARSLGASRIAVLRFVYWPAIRPGVLAGTVLGFAVSFDEVVIALFLQGSDAVTLPVRMYGAIQYELTPKIAASATLFLGLALLVLLLQSAPWRRTTAR